jgi:cytochrome b561
MERYVFSSRVLHWVMAVGFGLLWICGYAMTSLVADDTPLEDFLFGFHITIGVTLMVLLVLRIIVRLSNAAPAAPQFMTKWEKVVSHLGHLGLYLLPAVIILIGWAETDFGGHGVKWFGLPMPKVFPTLETLWGVNLESITTFLHKWTAYAMLALTIVHVAAVIKHKWIDGHDVLYRMTFSKKNKISQ